MIQFRRKDSKSMRSITRELGCSPQTISNQIKHGINLYHGSEFANLTNLKEISKTLVYYARPYTFCDKVNIKRHNGLIRCFIPKGDCIDNCTLQEIIEIQCLENNWYITHQMKYLKES